MATAKVGHHGPRQNHGLSHKAARRRGFGDLELHLSIPLPNASFGLIHQQRSLTDPPAPPPLHQSLQGSQLGLLGRRQLNQIIGIVVREPVRGCNPTPMHAGGGHRPVVIEFDPNAPGRIPLAGAQAEGAMAKGKRKHGQRAPGQVEAGGAATRFQIEGGSVHHQPTGIGHMDPDALLAIR